MNEYIQLFPINFVQKIGLTIFRRWRAVHGAEEQPSPGGFAMVFQKAPFSTNKLNSKNNPKNATKKLKKPTNSSSSISTIYDDSGGKKPFDTKQDIRKNVLQRNAATSTHSSMVSIH